MSQSQPDKPNAVSDLPEPSSQSDLGHQQTPPVRALDLGSILNPAPPLDALNDQRAVSSSLAGKARHCTTTTTTTTLKWQPVETPKDHGGLERPYIPLLPTVSSPLHDPSSSRSAYVPPVEFINATTQNPFADLAPPTSSPGHAVITTPSTREHLGYQTPDTHSSITGRKRSFEHLENAAADSVAVTESNLITQEDIPPTRPAKKGRPAKGKAASSSSSSPSTKKKASKPIDTRNIAGQPRELDISGAGSTSEATDDTVLLQQQRKGKKRGRPPKSETAGALKKKTKPNETKATGTEKRITRSAGRKASLVEQPTLHCVCRRPFESPWLMLDCYQCKKWFHGECVGLKRNECDFIDLYYCDACSKQTGKVTTRRPVCARDECQNASRLSIREPNPSKYCSQECGMIVARKRLEEATKKFNASQQSSGGSSSDSTATMLETLKRQREYQRSFANEERINRDKARIERIKQEMHERRAIIPQYDIQLKFVNAIMEAQALKNDKSVCGFDSRVQWQDYIWQLAKDVSRDGTEIHVDFGSNASRLSPKELEFFVCDEPKKKCVMHQEWLEIRKAEFEQLRGMNVAILLDLDEEKKALKARIKESRKPDVGWQIFDSGPVKH